MSIFPRFKSAKPADIVCIINGILEEACPNALSQVQTAETIRQIAELNGKGLRVGNGPEKVVCEILTKIGVFVSSGDFFSIQKKDVANALQKCKQEHGAFVHV